MTDIIDNKDNEAETAEPKSKYSLDYALEQIEKISASTAYLDQAISELRQMETSDGVGDIATQAKAQAIADVVRCRETTNQKLLDFYMKMADELSTKETDYKKEMLNTINLTLENLCSFASGSPDTITDALDTMRQILKETFPLQ